MFREDLYYRIMGLWILLPPLRDRREDIEDIAWDLAIARGFPERLMKDAIDYLKKRSYRGNVRELRSCLIRADIRSVGKITAALLAKIDAEEAAIRGSRETAMAPAWEDEALKARVPGLPLMEAIAHLVIERAIALERNNMTKAAARVQLNRSTFSRKVADLRARTLVVEGGEE
jgi:DNA-binding NtrC family response regulator